MRHAVWLLIALHACFAVYRADGVTPAVLLIASMLIGQVCKTHSLQHVLHTLFELRTALTTMVFAHSLALHQSTRQTESVGKIVNLVADDCHKLMEYPAGDLITATRMYSYKY